MSTINTGNGKQSTVQVYCTDSDKTVTAELIRMEKDKITVILPGFQKLILNRHTNLASIQLICLEWNLPAIRKISDISVVFEQNVYYK